MNANDYYSNLVCMTINQVIGRCIRNQNDYGAVYLIDKRFDKYIMFEKQKSKSNN
jgi:Rad3-related DNA helicase